MFPFPSTNTASEVRHVVAGALDSPEGMRGYTASNRAAGYGGMNAADYARKANENIIVIVYGETQAAIEKLDAVLAVPHVDCLWMGAMDLSQALGVTGDPNHPKVVRAMDMIIAKCKQAGVASGTIAVDCRSIPRGSGDPSKAGCPFRKRDDGEYLRGSSGPGRINVTGGDKIDAFHRGKVAEVSAPRGSRADEGDSHL